MNAWGLRTKLMIGGVVLSVVPLIILGIMAYYWTARSVHADTQNKLLIGARSAAQTADAIISSELINMGLQARTKEVIEAIKEANSVGIGEKANELVKIMGRWQEVAKDHYEFVYVADKRVTALRIPLGERRGG